MGFFESFNKGCGCAIGLVAGLVIASIILALLFGDLELVFGGFQIGF